jgi:co-chaperonin GroES (HSP10)
MRSIFIREFLQDSYAGYQESRLRKRKQGINEPAAEYYYEIINLCRLMDPNMSEEAKLHHLYEGLKPTLVEKIWVLQPKTCADFLAAVRRHTEATELACNKGWAVHMLAEEKEKEEEARVAAVGRDQQTDRNNEDPTIKQLLEVVQQLQGEIISMKKQGRKRDRSRADNRTTTNQSGQSAPPGRTADGRPICFYCKGEGHIKRYCQKKKNDDEIQNNTTVAMISTSDEENHQEIPLLQIDVGQLLLEEVTIGKKHPNKEGRSSN